MKGQKNSGKGSDKGATKKGNDLSELESLDKGWEDAAPVAAPRAPKTRFFLSSLDDDTGWKLKDLIAKAPEATASSQSQTSDEDTIDLKTVAAQNREFTQKVNTYLTENPKLAGWYWENGIDPKPQPKIPTLEEVIRGQKALQAQKQLQAIPAAPKKPQAPLQREEKAGLSERPMQWIRKNLATVTAVAALLVTSVASMALRHNAAPLPTDTTDAKTGSALDASIPMPQNLTTTNIDACAGTVDILRSPEGSYLPGTPEIKTTNILLCEEKIVDTLADQLNRMERQTLGALSHSSGVENTLKDAKVPDLGKFVNVEVQKDPAHQPVHVSAIPSGALKLSFAEAGSGKAPVVAGPVAPDVKPSGIPVTTNRVLTRAELTEKAGPTTTNQQKL